MKSIVLVCALVLGVSTLCNGACSIFENEMSNEDKVTVVNKHNELRRRISEGSVPGQPQGKNLKEIKYDETLAKRAQEIANSCIFAHQKVEDGRWHSVGQNLYISMSTAFSKGADWTGALQTWFDEYRYYSYGGPVTAQNGHYTQLVWANTEFVGCGYTSYEGNDGFKYQKLYVCNYGPAGNYVGETPYET